MTAGDRVRVEFPSNVIGVTDDMRPINGSIQTIKETHIVKGAKAQAGVMYALEGVTSRYGHPYWFLPEWLFPIVEVKL